MVMAMVMVMIMVMIVMMMVMMMTIMVHTAPSPSIVAYLPEVIPTGATGIGEHVSIQQEIKPCPEGAVTLAVTCVAKVCQP
jgi:hypothetical protein